jgi:flagellar motor protein MotB
MAIFDGLSFGSGGGGLLDLLKSLSSQTNYGQDFGDGLYGQQGMMPAMAPGPAMQPTQAQPSMAQPAMNAQAQMQPPAQAMEPNRFGAGLQGFVGNLHNGPIGALIGGLGGAITGQAPMSAATQRQQLLSSLEQAGVPRSQAMAAVLSGNNEVLKSMLDKYSKQDRFRPATAEERRTAGAKDDTPLYINTATGEPKFGPPQTNVSVNTEKTGQAELMTKGVNAFVESQAAARDSQKRIAMYDTLDKAAQGFTPGATAEIRLAAKRYLKDFGLIKGEDVPDGEIMQMISRQLAIHAMPKGQGAVSNYERELFAKSLPNLTQSPEGLKQAINISRKLEQFDAQVAQIYRDSAKANKGLPNYIEVQEKIAALGSPLGDAEMGALQGQPAQKSVPAPPQSQGSPKSGNYIWMPGKGLIEKK